MALFSGGGIIPRMKNCIHGVVAPMVTPLKPAGSLDVEGTGRLVEHILAGGVHGLFLLGTTGEAL